MIIGWVAEVRTDGSPKKPAPASGQVEWERCLCERKYALIEGKRSSKIGQVVEAKSQST